MWSRQESNLYLKFRKLLFYPLNYGTGWCVFLKPVAKIKFSGKCTAKICDLVGAAYICCPFYKYEIL